MSGWVRSSSCASGECIEVYRYGDGVIGIRNQKNGHGFAVLSSPQEWADFVAGIKAGEFDHLGDP